MDNPGASLFQGTDIQLNNSQNQEEEEDLEDQRRRNEELQSLLAAKLDDFNFDESTVNSSNNISMISVDEAQNKYRAAIEPSEQLKVLYDVRVREINNLKDEYNKYKVSKSKEIADLKNRLIISEAEIQQHKISLSSTESLLVEKTAIINDLKTALGTNEDKIGNYEKAIENFQLEIAAYQTTINDLQQKIADSNNPFCLGAKRYNSEEMQRAHEDQIHQLEVMLQEQSKRAKQFEKEKYALRDEIEKLIQNDVEDKQAINILTDNFDSAQKQCQELIGVVEMLSNENRHLQERIKSSVEESSEISTKKTSTDNPLETQIEKLKKMLLDKSLHIETLNAKLENYEDDIKELLEYRQLKTDIYKKKFQQCENKEHTTSLLLMQNDLQNYKRMIDDKSQQIVTLNTNNRELLEKMEELISQTRNDIQNFSYKYNMPQLEKMAHDLEAAQETIQDLEDKLKKSEEKRLSLVQQLQRPERNIEKELETQLSQFKSQYEKQKTNFENQLTKVQRELDMSVTEIQNLKEYADQLVNENVKLKSKIKEAESHKVTTSNDQEEEAMKKQYLEIVHKLKEAQDKVGSLEKTISELVKVQNVLNSEKKTYEYRVEDYRNEIKDAREKIVGLKDELETYSKRLEEKEEIINDLRRFEKELNEMREDHISKDNALRAFEENNKELMQLLQKANSELKAAKEEVARLQILLNEKSVRRNLENELKESEAAKEANQMGDGQDVELIKVELKLREEMQKEYFAKLNEMEKKYMQAPSASKEKACKEQIEILETKHREQMTVILTQCGYKIKGLQEYNEKLVKKIETMQLQFEDFKEKAIKNEETYKQFIKTTQAEGQLQLEEIKAKALQNEEAYKKLIKSTQMDGEKKLDDKWKKWSKEVLNNYCVTIGETHKNARETVSKAFNDGEAKVAAIEKSYNDKIKKYVKNCKI